MGLVDLGDGIDKLSPAPILNAMHLAAAAFDETPVALGHAGHLVALVRVDQEHHFVVAHNRLLSVSFASAATGVKQGV